MRFSYLRRFGRFVAIAVGVVGIGALVHAAPGDLDASFGTGGVALVTDPAFCGALYGLALAPDGKIVAMGGCAAGGSSSAPYLVRFNGDGTPDAGFGTGGALLVDLWGSFNSGLLVLGDSKILAADGPLIQRYGTTGALEATFANDFQLCNGYGICVNTLLPQPDGKILAGAAAGLVRYNADGTYDTGFGNGGMSSLQLNHRDIALQSDGRIVAVLGGSFNSVLVARYDVNGALDASFGGSGVVEIQRDHIAGVTAVAVQTDGKILALSSDYNRPTPPRYAGVLMRFGTNGALDPSFGVGGIAELAFTSNGFAWDIVVQADGKIVVAAQDQGFVVARFNTDGSPDGWFGSGGVVAGAGVGNALALQPDGKIVVAGGAAAGPAVMRFNADTTPGNTQAGVNVSIDVNGGIGTIGGITLEFSEVLSSGNTSAAGSSGVAPPTGYRIVGLSQGAPYYWDLNTTAVYAGQIDVCLHYDPALVTGSGSNLRLVHDAGSGWVDITSLPVDTTHQVICGTTTSLSPFALIEPVVVVYSWSGFLQPINADGSSIFKLGSTVPVKFQLTGASARITDAVANLFLAKVSNNVAGTDSEAVSTASADSGSAFRYDPSARQYVFNLSTKPLAKGTYQLRVDLHDGVTTRTVPISLK